MFARVHRAACQESSGSVRTLATQATRTVHAASSGQDKANVFDRSLKRVQRDRASALPGFGDVGYVRAEVARRLVERLHDVKREFPLVLDVGCNAGEVGVAMHEMDVLDHVGVQRMVQTDFSPGMLAQARANVLSSWESLRPGPKLHSLVSSEEYLPFPDRTYDLVVSSLSLHWVNDLPGALAQIQRCLKSDGMFLAAIPGGDTLVELRNAVLMAEQERKGGISARMSPLTTHVDVGSLLNRANFNLTTLDVDNIVVHYPDPYTVMHDLGLMGESNAPARSSRPLSRDEAAAIGAIYQHMYGEDTEYGMAVPATYQIIYVVGWAPDASQPAPKRRGSAQVSLTDMDEFLEQVEAKDKDIGKGKGNGSEKADNPK